MALYYEFEESIGYWMIMAARSYQRALDQELGPRGITWRQCQVLGYLALERDLTQTELAERMMVESPTLVGILDRMQRDGWILRHDCPRRPPQENHPPDFAGRASVVGDRRVRSPYSRPRHSRVKTSRSERCLRNLLGKVRENLTSRREC